MVGAARARLSDPHEIRSRDKSARVELPTGARVQAVAREAVGPRAFDVSPLWT